VLTLTKRASWNFGGQNLTDAWSASATLELPAYQYFSFGYTLKLATSDDHLTRGGAIAQAPRAHSLYASFGDDARKKFWVGGGGGGAWSAAGDSSSNSTCLFGLTRRAASV
jgi:hypothetical protein